MDAGDAGDVLLNFALLALFGLGSVLFMALAALGVYELATGRDAPPRPRRRPLWGARADGVVNLAIAAAVFLTMAAGMFAGSPTRRPEQIAGCLLLLGVVNYVARRAAGRRRAV